MYLPTNSTRFQKGEMFATNMNALTLGKAKSMFNTNSVDIEILSARAYNLRWATLPKGVIPLTAADPDFPVAAPIQKALKTT